MKIGNLPPIFRAAIGGNGLPNQGGDSLFLQRFSLRTHGAYDQTAAMKHSLEVQNPLVCGPIAGSNSQYPKGEYSAVSISDPRVLLWALKPAEEAMGNGVIARVWNVSNGPRTPAIQLATPDGAVIAVAKGTSHIETDEAPEPVTPAGIQPTLAAQQFRTFRLKLEGGIEAIPTLSATGLLALGILLTVAAAVCIRRSGTRVTRVE